MNEKLPALEGTVKKNLTVQYEDQRMTKNRRSIRLKGYDYSRAGVYFLTVCVQGRECLFGDVINEIMALNDAGKIVQAVWDDLPNHYPHVQLDQYVIMPNHFHGVVVIMASVRELHVGAGFKPAPTLDKRHALPEIIRGFKTFSSRRINKMRRTPGAKLWQRNYYEHIIRNEDELARIREYIINNPLQWEIDRENPAVTDTYHGRGTARRTPTGMAEPWEAAK